MELSQSNKYYHESFSFDKWEKNVQIQGTIRRVKKILPPKY